MILGEDDGSSVVMQRTLDYLAGVDAGLCQRSPE